MKFYLSNIISVIPSPVMHYFKILSIIITTDTRISKFLRNWNTLLVCTSFSIPKKKKKEKRKKEEGGEIKAGWKGKFPGSSAG